MLKHVDLCSGIGGFALGFEWAGLSRPVMFCDIEPWSRKILAKHWPDVPIEEDVKVLANDARRLVPDCDILTAGYPCQPFSVAGKQKGTEDDRHIWPHIFRIVAQKRPAWCVFENVYGHIALGLDQVLADLEAEGYATRTFIVPACGVNAPHRRDRLWIVGHTEHDGPSTTEVTGEHGKDEERRSERQGKAEQSAGTGQPRSNENVGYTEGNGCQRRGEAAGRKGQTHQLQQQLSVRSEPSRPSEDVAYAEGEQCNERQHEISREKAEEKWIRGEAGASGQNVADTESFGVQGLRPSGEQEPHTHAGKEVSMCGGEDVADTFSQRAQGRTAGRQDAENAWESSRGTREWNWDTEPNVGRVANGVPRRVDRLKGLGNAIVPQIAMNIGLAIRETNDHALQQRLRS